MSEFFLFWLDVLEHSLAMAFSLVFESWPALLVAVLGFAVSAIFKFRQRGRRGMRAYSRSALVGLRTVAIVFGVFFIFSIPYTVYVKSSQAQKDIKTANDAQMQAEKAVVAKDTEIDELRRKNTELQAQISVLARRESSPIQSPKPTGFRYFQKTIPSRWENARYAVQVSIQPEGVISPVMFEVECDVPLRGGSPVIIGYGTIMVHSDLVEGRKIFRFSIDSVQSVDPSKIVIVSLYSDKPIRVRNVRILDTF